MNEDAQIAAAWNIYRIKKDASLLSVFIRFMASQEERLREKAAYYVPADNLTSELKSALQGMMRVETKQLARIHALDKILECMA